MNKKTLKIFINSFMVSLFAIWVASELFFVAPHKQSREFHFPEKNIALFLSNEPHSSISSTNSGQIKSLALSSLDNKKEEPFVIDTNLFAWNDNTPAIRISSVEDAADIPLEYSGNTTRNSPAPKKKDIPKADSKEKKPAIIDNVHKDVDLPIQKIALKTEPKNTVKPLAATETMPVAQSTIEPIKTASSEEIFFIPLEVGAATPVRNDIIVANNAPENLLAMTTKGTVSIDTIAIENQKNKDKETSAWQSMASRADDNPWVVAKGAKHTNNQQIKEEVFYDNLTESEIQKALKPKNMEEEGEIKVTEMVRNILIPIPDKIMNDKNLTPQLVSPRKTGTRSDDDNESVDGDAKDGRSGGLLRSLSSIFSISSDGEEKAEEETVTSTTPTTRKKKTPSSGTKQTPNRILPAEMKLSFQPGRAEISGQTLRWIEAFALTAVEDPSVFLEIRIDRSSSFALQQRRLNLLHNILTNKGVGYHQINTVFTSREPNSFIIRTLRINEKNTNDTRRNQNQQSSPYQPW